MLITAFILPVLALAAYADVLASSPRDEVYGFSSEDLGGSSYLGVDTRDITPDRLSVLHLKEESGVEITMVDQDAPAGKAGLKEQDVILTLNGEKIASVEQLRRMIRETPSGRVVTLGISRDGQPMTFKVQLADRKKDFAYNFSPKDFHFEMPAMPAIPEIDVPVSIVVVHSSARSGLMVENLTPQLGDFFGAKNGQGVLVRSVEKGSRADKAGFRAGDVIVKINGEPIHDAGDFSHALRARKDNTASISILRDKKEQTITLTLPERKESQLEQESLETPELDAETTIDLGRFESEWADIGPQMEEAINQHLHDIKPNIEAINPELQKIEPEIQREQKELCSHRRDLQKQMREMQRQMREHLRQMRELRRQHCADI
jgi:membrane-associated protease RseP (regulator of RpoE activity)